MITCAECGATNGDDDQFCGTCGEFLRWDAEAGRSPTRSADGPRQTDRSTDHGLTAGGVATGPTEAGRTGDGRTETDHAADPPTGTGRNTQARTAGRATPSWVETGQAVDSRSGTGGAVGGQAGSAGPPTGLDPPGPSVATPVPVDETMAADTSRDVPPRQPGGTSNRTGGTQPAPRQPGPPDRRGQSGDPAPTPAVDLPSRPPEPRLTCPACGADNAPGRRFCRSCGAPLAAATAGPAPRRTWWQRWWDRLRRRGARRTLRDERRAARAGRQTLLIVIVLCLIGVLAITGPPLVRRAVEAVRDRTEDPTPLVPTSVAASSEATGAGASRLTDGANNRYWAPSGRAVDSWVEGRFNEPVRLLTVVITPGVSPRRQAFLAAGRPRGLTVVTVDAEGKQRKIDIELRDEPGEQHFDVEASKVVRIRLVVRSTYGSGLIPSVAIGEAEFFGRR